MLRISVLTVSDRAASGERPDASGPALVERVRAEGWQVVRTAVLPDDLGALSAALADWADSGDSDVILTTGGTGFSPRDVTPEATQAIITRPAQGLAEAMRQGSLKVTPHAMLSRATAGIRGATLVINLPGSPRAAVENLETVLPVLAHAVQLLSQDPGAEAGHQVGSEKTG